MARADLTHPVSESGTRLLPFPRLLLAEHTIRTSYAVVFDKATTRARPAWNLLGWYGQNHPAGRHCTGIGNF
jgi:hypothetical protein